VLEVIHAFEQASSTDIPYDVAPRRPGDAALCYADASKANSELGWQAHYDLQRMCEDVWRWQQKHPFGYRTET
jgi:UDP-glucose 4-epimerase